MKEYYIHDGAAQKGPMSLEDVLKSGINGETLIWYTGLNSWTPAKDTEELKLLFEQKAPPPLNSTPPPPPPLAPQPPLAPPPPVSNTVSPTPAPVASKKSGNAGIKWLLYILIACIVGFAIVVIKSRNHASDTANGYATSPAVYSESKMSVKDYERTHPTEFLKASGTYNQTLFGNKMKVHGSVSNNATVANFKDINIEVRYYSSTNTLISTEQFVLYDYVPAHSTKSFEWKVKPPGGTESMRWTAVGATPYY